MKIKTFKTPNQMSIKELLKEINDIQDSLKINPVVAYSDNDNRTFRLYNLIKEYNLR
jgi:hypothetical protein